MDSFEAVAPAVAIAPERPRPDLWRQGLALLIGSAVIYAVMIYNGSSYEGDWAPTEETALDIVSWAAFYLIAGGGWLLLSLRLISRESFAALNIAPGSLWSDARAGVSLCFSAIVLSSLASWVIYSLPGYTETAAAEDMSAVNHLGLAMVLASSFYDWTAAAVFEELLRTFTISRLLKFGDTQGMRIAAVGITTVLFGAYHLYYGIYGALSIAVIGLVFGSHYIRHGRILPLILAHGLFNTWTTLYDLYG